jgi:hypothetical protein
VSDVPLQSIVLHVTAGCLNLKDLVTLSKIINSYTRMYTAQNNLPAKVLNSCVSFQT